jgi:hypothetical protein
MKKIMISVLLLVMGFTVYAQQSPKLLVQKDLDRFITSYEKMYAELEKIDFDNSESVTPGWDAAFLAAVRANREVMKIFRKYGWDENTLVKIAAIINSYAVIYFNREMAGAEESIQQAMEEIKNNPMLTEEAKQAYIANFTSNINASRTEIEKLKKTIHPEDYSLIERNFSRLDKVIQVEETDYEDYLGS